MKSDCNGIERAKRMARYDLRGLHRVLEKARVGVEAELKSFTAAVENMDVDKYDYCIICGQAAKKEDALWDEDANTWCYKCSDKDDQTDVAIRDKHD